MVVQRRLRNCGSRFAYNIVSPIQFFGCAPSEHACLYPFSLLLNHPIMWYYRQSFRVCDPYNLLGTIYTWSKFHLAFPLNIFKHVWFSYCYARHSHAALLTFSSRSSLYRSENYNNMLLQATENYEKAVQLNWNSPQVFFFIKFLKVPCRFIWNQVPQLSLLFVTTFYCWFQLFMKSISGTQ